MMGRIYMCGGFVSSSFFFFFLGWNLLLLFSALNLEGELVLECSTLFSTGQTCNSGYSVGVFKRFQIGPKF